MDDTHEHGAHEGASAGFLQSLVDLFNSAVRTWLGGAMVAGLGVIALAVWASLSLPLRDLTHPLPTLDRLNTNVLVTDLDGDDSPSPECKLSWLIDKKDCHPEAYRITTELNDDLDNSDPNILVKFFQIDRTLESTYGSNITDLHRAAVIKGMEWLNHTGGAVLVWGRMNKISTTIYLLPRNSDSLSNSIDRPMVVNNGSLKNFMPALRVAVLSEVSVANKDGQFVAPELKPAVDRMRPLIAHIDAFPEANVRGEIWLAYGDAKEKLGEQSGGYLLLTDAINAYERAKKEYSGAAFLQDWATAEDHEAIALQTLGANKADAKTLEQSFQAFELALAKQKLVPSRLGWANTSISLGDAYETLGEREVDSKYLDAAVTTYHNAMDVYDKQGSALDQATVRAHLANALSTRGDREVGTADLKQSQSLYEAALNTLTRKAYPDYWAETEDDYSGVLEALGERNADTQMLKNSVSGYRAALGARDPRLAPQEWATTRSNLCNALRALGEREQNSDILRESINACNEALEVRKYDTDGDLTWAETQNNLGNSWRALGTLEPGVAHLKVALDAYDQALTKRTRQDALRDWAETQRDIGITLTLIGQRDGSIPELRAAAASFKKSLAGFTQAAALYDWKKTQDALVSCQALIVKMKG